MYCILAVVEIAACQLLVLHVDIPYVTDLNKKALLSQRRPRDAPNIWVP